MDEELRRFWVDGRGSKGKYGGRWTTYHWNGSQIRETEGKATLDEQIEEALADGKETPKSIASYIEMQVHEKTVRRRLDRMLEDGIVEVSGTTSNRKYQLRTSDTP